MTDHPTKVTIVTKGIRAEAKRIKREDGSIEWGIVSITKEAEK
jgi:hypothetical protein